MICEVRGHGLIPDSKFQRGAAAASGGVLRIDVDCDGPVSQGASALRFV
jgi:hypothetical protein